MIRLIDDLGPREISIEQLGEGQMAEVTYNEHNALQVGHIVMRVADALIDLSSPTKETWCNFYNSSTRLNDPQRWRVRVLRTGARMEVC